MKLTIGNIDTAVECSDEERAWLDQYLSFEDTQAYWANRHYGGGDGRVHLLKRNRYTSTLTFPTGMLRSVLNAPELKFPIEQFDDRVPALPVLVDMGALIEWLRDYQLKALKIALDKERGILWLPTGAGKTEIAAGLAVAAPGRWLFLVHRNQLAFQASERYTLRTKLPVGTIIEGQWTIPDDAGLVCATFQTLIAALKRDPKFVKNFLAQVEGLIVDESHVLPAETFYEVAQLCVTARRRIGLSGTPLARGDRRSLMSVAALGNVLYRIKPEVLIDAGVLARPTIYTVEVKHHANNPTYQGVYGAAIVRNTERNKAVVDLVKIANRPAMVFVAQIAHGRDLTKRLERAGVGRVKFIWGNKSTDERKTALRDIAAGRIDVIVTSAVFQEGIDVPELESVIVAGGGKSVIAALQRIGRGMRVLKDASGKVIKSTFEVFDVTDIPCGICTGKNKKPLHTACRWLERHTKARFAAYAGESYEIKPHTMKVQLTDPDEPESEEREQKIADDEHDASRHFGE